MGFGAILKADAIVPEAGGYFWTEYILRFSRVKAAEGDFPGKGAGRSRAGHGTIEEKPRLPRTQAGQGQD